ncbi:hypothetical protein [Qipengyuania atrilutea]|uniref:Uncharacterized protein n=1 Tax=Qipengyuania atrilutea TaxID=2744473 RepID=A0A850H8S5_9SPHN|nr:hypothetical protein [Actirhodobacter atriluteus]NVD43489.1 hypothetical protein [Actirhodobacter atriluteus]
MSLGAAIAVTFRIMMILLACAMVIGWWEKFLAVLLRRPGWKGHLSSFVVTVIALGCAIGSSVNMFPDAGWHINENLRLFVLNIAMAMIICGLLTSVYRRALRAGPEAARAAFLSGLLLIFPASGFVALLTIYGGANG